MLSLNCLVHTEPRNHIFGIDAPKEWKVIDLKEAICQKVQEGWVEHEITLWQVSILDDEGLDHAVRNLKLEDNEGVKRLGIRSLGYYYQNPPAPDHLHIIVQPPAAHESPVIPDPGGLDQTMMDIESSIREDVAVFLKDLKKVTKMDLDHNHIKLKAAPGNIDEQGGSHAKEFVNKLTAKLRYRESSDDFLLQDLKQCLGGDFDKHFTADTTADSQEYFVTRDVLSSCSRLMVKLGPNGRFNYHEGYTPLAKEIDLAGLVVDDAISIVTPSYNRDKEHAIIETRKSTGSKKSKPWRPRSDFHVAYGEKGTGYGILHGETDSQGLTELDAMFKSCLISCHSWKVMNKLSGKGDHVILSAYVSYKVCSMHIFYKSNIYGFIHQCIFRERGMFRNPPRALEFLRYMHNFAAIANQFRLNIPEENANVEYALMAITEDNETTESTTAAETTMVLSKLGFEVDRDSSEGDITYLRKSNRPFVAKRVRRKVELEILEHLKSAPFSLYHNHTVPIFHILHLSNNNALIVMPYHTVLSKISSLSEEWYYKLRFELVEAVAFIHDQDIVHRDIKPHNLLVDFKTSSSPHLIVIDFGIAIWHSQQDRLCNGFRGTEGWTAPEIREGAHWDPRAAEVWAVGKTLHYMAKLAGISDEICVSLLCDNPSLRPTLFDFIKNIQRTKRKRSVTAPQKEQRMVQHTALP